MNESPDTSHQEGLPQQIDLYTAYRACNPEDRVDRWTFFKKLEEKSEDEKRAFVATTIEHYQAQLKVEEQKVRDTIDRLRKDPAEFQRVGRELLSRREEAGI